jgi:hypothetical protein
MKAVTRSGTGFSALCCALTLLAMVGQACSSSHDTKRSSGDQNTQSGDGDDRATSGDAGAGASDTQCRAASECVLIGKGCCGCGPDSKEHVRAVPVTQQKAAQHEECPDQVACGACEVKVYDPSSPELRADCQGGECVVVDLRERAVSACGADTDCALVQVGCCGSCGGDPSGWLALHVGEPDELAPVCDPIPPCDACITETKPEAFCAADKHCAVRATPSVHDVPSDTCFSPTRNLETAYSDGVGCDCFERGAVTCVADKTGKNVALICSEQGSWQAVEDGPCDPGM